MSFEAGTLFYAVDADTSGLLRAEREVDSSTRRMERGFQDSGKETDKLGRSMGRLNPVARGVRQETQRLTGSLDGMKKAAQLAGSALAVIGVTMGLRDAIAQVMDFQDAMNGLAAVSGATTDQMADLEQQARQLGATSQFSASQAANAQRFLAQAGFEVNEVLGATPGLLQLATAGQLDLAQAADIASNVLGGMRMEVEELGRVNDVLAATAAGANTDVMQLGNALSYAAPFAAAAGVSIEEASAAIGVMSDAGIQGSRAGTGLIGVIRQLSNVTSAGEGALARYGLSVEDVDIKTHGLTEVMRRLEPLAEDTASAIQLFGSEAGAAAQVLMGGNRRLAGFTGELEGAEGKAAEMAATLDRGLRPALRSLQSAMAESILQLGDSGLAGGLENVIRLATGVISVWNGMGDAWAEANGVGERTLRMVERLAQAIQVMAAMAAGRAVQGIGSLIVAKAGLTAGTLTLTGALTGLRAVMMTLFGPVGLIAGAVGALYAFREELGLVDTAAKNASEALLANAGAIKAGSEAALDSSYDDLVNSLEAVSLQAQEAMAQLMELTARQNFYENSHKGMAASVAEAIGTQEAAMAKLWERQVELQRAIRENREARENLNRSDREGVEATQVLVHATTDLGEASKDATRELERQAEAQQRLVDRLFPLEAAARQYRLEQEKLEEAHNAGKVDDLAEAQRRLAAAYRETVESLGGFEDVFDAYPQLFDPEEQEADFWTKWLEGAENAFSDFDRMAADLAENFTRQTGDMFADVLLNQRSFSDGFQSMMQGLARQVVAAIGQMIAQWLAYKAVTSSLGFGLLGGGGGVLGGFSGLFDKGGRIPGGQWGIAGENGPEIIRGPAEIISTKETARIIGTSASSYQPSPSIGASSAAPQPAPVNINVTNNSPAQIDIRERANDDGSRDIDVFVADIMGDGPRSKAIRSKFGLSPRGR